MILMAHSYTADLRFSPMLTEVYSDTKKVFSRNPRMITAPIQNCQWKEREEKRERGGGGRRGRGEEGGGVGRGEKREGEGGERRGWGGGGNRKMSNKRRQRMRWRNRKGTKEKVQEIAACTVDI